jgi:hypothetical protein
MYRTAIPQDGVYSTILGSLNLVEIGILVGILVETILTIIPKIMVFLIILVWVLGIAIPGLPS